LQKAKVGLLHRERRWLSIMSLVSFFVDARSMVNSSIAPIEQNLAILHLSCNLPKQAFA
jgi:hypothetical protein